MRNILMVSVFIFALTAISFADDAGAPADTKGYIEPRIGFEAPWSTGIGFYGGLLGGVKIDQIVSLNADLDYYRTSFVTTSTNTYGAIPSSQIGSQTTANLYMLFANVRIEVPYLIGGVVQPYAQIGLGYDFMYNTYQQSSGDQGYLFAEDFLAFRIEIGGQVALGDRTYLYLMAGYTISTVESQETAGLEQIATSGFSVLCGVGFKI